jgi:hypothetical protein
MRHRPRGLCRREARASAPQPIFDPPSLAAAPRSSGSAGGGAAGDGAGEGGSDDEEEQVRRALALIFALDPPL